MSKLSHTKAPSTAVGTNNGLGRFHGLRKMCQDCDEVTVQKPVYCYPDWVYLHCDKCGGKTGKVPFNANAYPSKPKIVNQKQVKSTNRAHWGCSAYVAQH